MRDKAARMALVVEMDSETKVSLESLAFERLEATAENDERWFFLFRTEGAVDFIYCP